MGLPLRADGDPEGAQRLDGLHADLGVVGAHLGVVVRQGYLEVEHRDGRHAGTAQQHVDPRVPLVRDQPEPDPPTHLLVGVGEVEVPALAPQRFGAWRVAVLVVGAGPQRLRPRGLRQDRQRVGVEDVLAVTRDHRHEHLVTALGALDEHGRHDRHQHAEEALAAHAFADVVDSHAGRGAERLGVGGQQRVVVLAAPLDGQCAAEEVGDVGERRAPGDGLPVHDGQRPVGAGLAEQHVVEPVVAVDQAAWTVPLGFAGQVGVEGLDQSLADLAVLLGDLVAIAFDESGVQRGDQRLVHRRLPIEPVVGCQRLVVEQRTVHERELAQRQSRLFCGGAADLVADDRRRGVTEHEVEGTGSGVVGRVVARRDRSVQAGGDGGVEVDFTFVEAHRQPRLTAAGVGCGDLEHDRGRAGLLVGVGQSNAITLAHLTGADPLNGEVAHRGPAEDVGQPVGGEVGGTFDERGAQRRRHRANV